MSLTGVRFQRLASKVSIHCSTRFPPYLAPLRNRTPVPHMFSPRLFVPGTFLLLLRSHPQTNYRKAKHARSQDSAIPLSRCDFNTHGQTQLNVISFNCWARVPQMFWHHCSNISELGINFHVIIRGGFKITSEETVHRVQDGTRRLSETFI